MKDGISLKNAAPTKAREGIISTISIFKIKTDIKRINKPPYN